MEDKNKAKLQYWQAKLSEALNQYNDELSEMDKRESLYRGSHNIDKMIKNDDAEKAYIVHNIIAENIEAQIDSSIPMPKVTARHKEDEELARKIEDMLRNEMDRLPIEMINDLMERTVPLQGGGFYLVEWDHTAKTHITSGEVSLSALHPKYIIPQDGVTSSVDDMDHIFVRQPSSKMKILQKYGVSVEDESEDAPEIRGAGEEAEADNIVTQYIVYYKDKSGDIGMFSWVGDTVVCDIPAYQKRRMLTCENCGGTLQNENGTCAECNGKMKEQANEYETLGMPVYLSNGNVLTDREKIPYYTPNVFPVVLQRNVSTFGKLLGESDADKIKDQQNAINRITNDVIERLLDGGSYMTLPSESKIKKDSKNKKVIHLESPSDAAMINVYDMQMDTSQSMAIIQSIYKQSQQLIGVTDSFLGRVDSTATSGKAKEFSAAQAAGRMESKRTMKKAAYARIYEMIFKYKLAYADEPRPVVSHDALGKKIYSEFSRFDFLKKDAAGEYYWEDDFLFDCDAASTLSTNRQSMWQETRNNLQSGAFGDPAQLSTLILFWSKMESLSYPGAGETKRYLEEQQAAQMQAAQMNLAQGGLPNVT